VQAAKNSFLCRVSLTLSSKILERLREEPLLLCMERSQLRCFGICSGSLSGGVRDLRADPEHNGGIVWDPQVELDEVAREKDIWAYLDCCHHDPVQDKRGII